MICMVISVINIEKTDFSSVEEEMEKMERYYQQEIETADREQVLAWQNERLVKQVRHVWDNVPYYRAKMEEKGVAPEDIQSVADLHKLPFLTKDDLREAYPYGLLAKPLKDCVAFSARTHDAPSFNSAPYMLAEGNKYASL